MKYYIFSLILFITSCEIPHTNENGEYIICNVYDESRRAIILCPMKQVEINIGTINKEGNFTIQFLTINNQVKEFGNKILNIGEIINLDNNMSYVQINPKLVGTTKILINNGEINLSLIIN